MRQSKGLSGATRRGIVERGQSPPPGGSRLPAMIPLESLISPVIKAY